MTTIDTTGLRTRAQAAARAGGDIHIAPGSFFALLDALDRAEAERDEWRQTALDERGAALDALEQVKVRDARIKAVEDVLTTVEDGHSTDPVIRGMFPRMVNTDLIRRALDGDA